MREKNICKIHPYHSSSKFADDVVFDKYLTEASGILKEAKESMRSRHDEELVEVILNRSAMLLSQAIAMKPMSLLAVGQSDDVRSLYNWGLALSFRAQLIADIRQEAAFDADKLFLAAIDIFDAMMTRGNVHAPDALFRWESYCSKGLA
ncbi:hypothetical protein CRYUN_Cryun31cG0027700 [Craigia yunnanensis]